MIDEAWLTQQLRKALLVQVVMSIVLATLFVATLAERIVVGFDLSDCREQLQHETNVCDDRVQAASGACKEPDHD